jgi:hypothetical protein
MVKIIMQMILDDAHEVAASQVKYFNASGALGLELGALKSQVIAGFLIYQMCGVHVSGCTLI